MSADTSEGAAALKPKRSFFNKSSWKTEVKDDGPKKNMFSHSAELFPAIVREEKKRKEEEKRLKAEKKKRKQAEDHERKRRKISSDYEEDSKAHQSELRTSPRTSRKESKARSRTPRSPSAAYQHASNSLSARYDSLTKSPSTAGTPTDDTSPNVIDLGGSDSDSADLPYKPSQCRSSQLPSRPAPPADDGVEEVEDPELAELTRQARERGAAKVSAGTAAPAYDPTVQLFVDPHLPEGAPLMVKVNCSKTMEQVHAAYCDRMGFSPELTAQVFLTWKLNKVYSSTTIRRLGISVDRNGVVSVDGQSDLFDESNLPKIHLEAWTRGTFQEMKREKAAEEAKEKAAEKRAAEEAASKTESPEQESTSKPDKPQYRLFLKAKGKNEWRVSVHGHTTIEVLASGYKDANGVSADTPVTLFFDGERLSPMDTIADTEIEDKDAIEVHFK